MERSLLILGSSVRFGFRLTHLLFFDPSPHTDASLVSWAGFSSFWVAISWHRCIRRTSSLWLHLSYYSYKSNMRNTSWREPIVGPNINWCWDPGCDSGFGVFALWSFVRFCGTENPKSEPASQGLVPTFSWLGKVHCSITSSCLTPLPRLFIFSHSRSEFFSAFLKMYSTNSPFGLASLISRCLPKIFATSYLHSEICSISFCPPSLKFRGFLDSNREKDLGFIHLLYVFFSSLSLYFLE